MGKTPSQRKRNPKSNKTEAFRSKSSKPKKVENFTKQNNTGHELGKADKSHNPIDQRPLPPNPLDRRPLPPNPEGLIPPFKRLKIGEESKDGVKSLSLPIKQKQDAKKNAKQNSLTTESKQRTETVNSKQKNKRKQKQEDTTQATRTDTPAMKGSVIHNESSQRSTGQKRAKVTSISQNSLIQKPLLAESQERKTENIANPRRQTKQIEVKPKTNYSPLLHEKQTWLLSENREQFPTVLEKPIISVTGLLNLGNTCFFNAAMQNLNQSFVLGELLSEQKLDLPLTTSMVEFYKQMGSKGNKPLDPSFLFQSICSRSPKFKGGKQQDSHELLRHLLDGLRNEERQVSTETEKRKVLTKVDKVFGGHFLTIYTCNDCTKPYHVLEPFLDISLPIQQHQFSNEKEYNIDEDTAARQTTEDELKFHVAAKFLMKPLKESQDTGKSGFSTKGSDSNSQSCSRKRSNDSAALSGSRKRNRTDGPSARSILDCLNAFTRTESITKEYLCMACNEKRCSQGETDYQMSSAIKKTLVLNPPALLTLHLKRFTQTSRGFVKCNNMITFPDMLDLGPYCSSCCLRNDGNEKDIWYSLYGVVVHGGDLSGGHYTAYVKVKQRTQDVNTKQFLQSTFLDRDELTKEKLVQMTKDMETHLQLNPRKEWRPHEAVQGTWFYASDSHCAKVHENEVFQRPAYLLFYERMTRPLDDLH